MRAMLMLAATATLAACSATTEVAGGDLDPAVATVVRARVRAILAREPALGTEIASSSLAGTPRTAAVFAALGLVRRGSAGYAFTRAGAAAGTACGATCIAIDLVTQRYGAIRRETVVTPGFREAGSRLFVLDVDVAPAATPLARALARSGAIVCHDLGGEPIAVGARAVVPALFYTGYDPARPNDGQARAGLGEAIRPDCDVRR